MPASSEFTNDLQNKAKNIRLLLLDVDGVLTDGKLYFNNDGSEMKAFSTLDGHGIKMLQKSGVLVGIITGRTSQLVAKRAADLGIKILVQGREDKLQALQEIIALRNIASDNITLKNIALKNIALENIAFMGDDWPDLAVVRRVGLGLTVANAHCALVEHADWQSQYRGGEGAVREACDLIMRAQNTYAQALEPYL